jgi:hypothetical protein
MISYETNLNAAAVERLSEITDQCEGGILGSLIAAACSGVAALLLGGFYAALGIKPLHYAAIAVSLVALGLTLQSLWILLASIHKVKSLMGGSYWRLPDGPRRSSPSIFSPGRRSSRPSARIKATSIGSR